MRRANRAADPDRSVRATDQSGWRSIRRVGCRPVRPAINPSTRQSGDPAIGLGGHQEM